MKLHYLVLFVALSFIACNNSKSTKVDAVASQEAPLASGEKLMVDTTLSSIHWQGFKPGGSHHGVLLVKSGELFIENDKLTSGVFVLDMNSIMCEDLTDKDMAGKLVGHLKSPDFFDVAQFPEGKFTITSVEEIAKTDTALNVKINGNLELKGISKNISFDAALTQQDGLYSAKTQNFMINRTQWGVNYGSKNIFKDLKDKFINDDMEVQILIAAKKI